MKKRLKIIRWYLRALHRACPKCDSSAPKCGTCKLCNNERYPTRKQTFTRLKLYRHLVKYDQSEEWLWIQ